MTCKSMLRGSSLFFGFALGCVLFATNPATGAAANDPTTRELIALNQKLQDATKSFDVATLKRLISGDYKLVSSTGKVYDRNAFLADAADHSIQYEINQPEEVTVHHYNDDAAVVAAILHVRYRTSDKVVDVRIRYADTWIKMGGRWRYVFGEASPIK